MLYANDNLSKNILQLRKHLVSVSYKQNKSSLFIPHYSSNTTKNNENGYIGI